MPPFAPGESAIAVATFPVKPAGLPCTAELWLVSDMTKVATSDAIPFIATGEDQSISLPIALPGVKGTYPVLLDIKSNGQRIAAFRGDEDVEISALLTISYEGWAPFWNIRIYNPSTRTWIDGTPPELKESDIPCSFDIEAGQYAIKITEWSISATYEQGPYLLTIPSIGSYIWNASAETLDGITTVDLPNTSNRSLVTGVLENIMWVPGGWRANIRIDKAEDVPGYYNVAQYYDIAEFVLIDIPTAPGGGPGVEIGRSITCYMDMRRTEITADWHAWDFHYTPEYPPEAFIFSGSLSLGEIVEGFITNGYPIPASFQYVYWQVSGVSPFTAILQQYNYYGYGVGGESVIGPGSWVTLLPHGGSFMIWAHPGLDPTPWTQATWQLNNWVRVV